MNFVKSIVNLTLQNKASTLSLLQELQDAEGACMKPANERLRRENELTEKQNDELDKLIVRKEALVKRLEKVLQDDELNDSDRGS